jgi:group I intron endonuclease
VICYRLTNTVNGKAYIGSTGRTLKKRWEQHQAAKTVIGRAIRKYGKAVFTVEEIACARNRDDLMAVETAIIAAEKTLTPHGYNVASDARNGMLGRQVSPEAKAKMGPKISAALKIAYANGTKKTPLGRKASLETKQKLSRIRQGHSVSAETRAKIGAANRGHVMSAEQRKTLSDTTKAAWARGHTFGRELKRKTH